MSMSTRLAAVNGVLISGAISFPFNVPMHGQYTPMHSCTPTAHQKDNVAENKSEEKPKRLAVPNKEY